MVAVVANLVGAVGAEVAGVMVMQVAGVADPVVAVVVHWAVVWGWVVV